jgi:hypothetical protein
MHHALLQQKQGRTKGYGCRAAALPTHQNRNLKNKDFVDIMTSKVLRCFTLLRKSATEIGLEFGNKLIKLKKQQGMRDCD